MKILNVAVLICYDNDQSENNTTDKENAENETSKENIDINDPVRLENSSGKCLEVISDNVRMFLV